MNEFIVYFFDFIIIMNIKYIVKNDFRLDFNRLATQHPPLYKHLVILDYQTVINFKSQESLICLTEAIMKCIFDIHWSCPKENLCPRIPNRLNYIIWLDKYAQIPIKKAVDIGCGSTIIYPLIGYRLKKWKFIATEINQQSLIFSKNIVEKNNLNQYIEVRKATKNKYLEGCVFQEDQIDIVMCNPPFFDQNDKNQPLGTMKPNEYRVEGGEYEFFFNFYTQSFKFPFIKGFSCLIGRQKDFQEIQKFMQQEKEEYDILEKLKLGEIHQGNNKRFIVYWKPKYK